MEVKQRQDTIMSSLKMGNGHDLEKDEEIKEEESAEIENESEEKEAEEPEIKEEEEPKETEPKGDEPAVPTEEKPMEEVPEVTEPTPEQRLEALHQEEEKIRHNIVELRKERRSVREEEVPLVVPKEKRDDLSDIAESDVELIDKAARARGYMTRDEFQQITYKEKVNSFTDAWYEKHPEYKAENDPDDKNWKKLDEVTKQYFKAPKDPRDIGKILDLADQMIKPSKITPKTIASVAAAKEKLQANSKGTGGSTPKAAKEAPNPKLRGAFQGFSEDELNEMFN